MCHDKFRRLGRVWAYATTPLLSATELEVLAAAARDSGVAPGIVHADGPTRIEDDDG